MDEKLLEPQAKSCRNNTAVYTKPKNDGEIFIWHEDGWQYFNCTKIVYKENTSVEKNIVIEDFGRKNKERYKKLKNIVKRFLCPEYRLSYQIARYIGKGYSAQETLSKNGTIEV